LQNQKGRAQFLKDALTQVFNRPLHSNVQETAGASDAISENTESPTAGSTAIANHTPAMGGASSHRCRSKRRNAEAKRRNTDGCIAA
jgi:hypothetical protein